jgi:lipopolysaccharide export system permease protein
MAQGREALKTTIYRYTIREILPVFAAGMALAVFTVLATRMLSITELIITRGVPSSRVMGLIGYLLPDVVHFSLPATALIAVVMAFLRMSADSEIIALKASGVSLYQLMPPVLVMALAAAAVSAWLGTTASPWGQRAFRDLIYSIARSQADVAIKERVFSEPFKGVVFYVHSYDTREKVMKDVFVADRRDKSMTSTVVAREARLINHPDRRSITIRFTGGTVFVTDKNLASSRTVAFSSYDLTIGLKDLIESLSARDRSQKEMTAAELVRRMAEVDKSSMQYNEIVIELLEKVSLPIAVFLMAVIGVPLGVYMRGKGRFSGVGASLAVFVAYYLCLMGSRNIGESGYLPPAAVVWLPVAFLAISSFYAFLRIGAEKPLLPEWLRSALLRISGTERL